MRYGLPTSSLLHGRRSFQRPRVSWSLDFRPASHELYCTSLIETVLLYTPNDVESSGFGTEPKSVHIHNYVFQTNHGGLIRSLHLQFALMMSRAGPGNRSCIRT